MFRTSVAVAAIAALVGLGHAIASTPHPSNAAPRASSPLEHTFLIFFEEDEAGLTPEGREILATAARAAKGMGQARIAIMVPTSQLTGARTQAVKSELLHDGVKARIATAGQPQDIAYADADPTVRAWLDRRAVVVVSPAPDAASGPEARLIGDIIQR